MPLKSYPVRFTPDSYEKLTELAGNYLTEIDEAIQLVLSRRPRQGVPFDNKMRAIKLSPPWGSIVVAYTFDEESVFVEKIFGTPPPA